MLGDVDIEVSDNRDAERYEVFSGGQLAGFAQYRLRDSRITIFHTEVDPAFEGRGIGGRLARAALDDIKQRGLELVPLCPFIAEHVRRHPADYLELVIPAARESLMSGG